VTPQDGITGGKPASPIAASSGRRFGVAEWFGWGGLAFVVLIGALSSGFGGAIGLLGLFALVVGVIALVRGRVGWARLGSRAAGGAALGAALVLIIIGGVAAPPTTPTSVTVVAPSKTKPAAPSTGLSTTSAATTTRPTPTATSSPTISKSTSASPSSTSSRPTSTQSAPHPFLVWLKEGGFSGTSWYPHVKAAEDKVGALWISTDLYPDSDAKAPAQAICAAASSYEITEVGEFTGVSVRAADGQRLVLRITLSDKC
jgi:hypothetical protein